MTVFPPPVNLMTDNKVSSTRTLAVGARNDYLRVEDFEKSQLVEDKERLN